MSVRRSTLVRPLVIVAAVAASSLYAIAQQPPTPSRVRGTIEAVDGEVLAVKSRSGEDFKLHMAADMRVFGITRISLADIKVGSFIGTTTVPGPDGAPTAVEVHVFPEDMRGTGEGSRPFDLRPNSTMTNATVAQSVVGNEGHTLTVKYKDGEKKVLVSPDTPVVTYVSADRSELKAGAKVIAFIKALPDGSFDTNRISVGLNGLTPPM
jgi:molybdopterin-binding protein